MPHSNFPNGFNNGLLVRGLPVFNSYSNRAWFVDSGGTVNGEGTFTRPFAGLQQAIDACDANKGHIIVAKAGHAESVSSATALAFNKAGVSICAAPGARGSKTPTLTFDTATTANVSVTGADMSVNGFRLLANFADVASMFTCKAGGTDFAIDGCRVEDTSSVLNALTLVTTTVSVAADGLQVSNNRIISKGTTAATTLIKVAGTHDRIAINDNLYNGAVLNNTAALLAHGALVVTNLEMARNRVFRPNTDTSTGGILITTSSTTNTGIVYDNYVCHADVAAAILVTAGCIYGMVNNLSIGDADASAFVLPAIGAN